MERPFLEKKYAKNGIKRDGDLSPQCAEFEGVQLISANHVMCKFVIKTRKIGQNIGGNYWRAVKFGEAGTADDEENS